VQLLGWKYFMPGLVVQSIAVPLTLWLLEVVVVGYVLLRVAGVVFCETGTVMAWVGTSSQYQCSTKVLHWGPLALVVLTVGLLLARAIVEGVLSVMTVPMVHTRELRNRE
jgi:hypothetical protein